MTAVATPQAQLFDRLIAQGKDTEPWAYLVLSACEGEQGLSRYLDDGVEPVKPKKPAKAKAKGKGAKDADDAEVPESPRAYLEAIGVRGFRGIGPESALKLRPGPGLTLVIGRNGSGKSSFAEALEVLLTGTSVRWADKGSRFWKEGWRNLHDGVEPQVRARLVAEGIGQVELTRSWIGDQEVDDGTTVASGAGKKLTDLAGLGWEAAVQDFRPFMSHSELASRFEDGPTVLYRALLKGLGLEAFEGIRECLAKAQAARRKQKSEAKDTAKLLIEDAKRVQAATPDERIAETIGAAVGEGVRPRSARRARHRHQRRSGVAAVAARAWWRARKGRTWPARRRSPKASASPPRRCAISPRRKPGDPPKSPRCSRPR